MEDVEVDYADGLKGCLPEEDVVVLNHACEVFEGHLIDWYPNKDSNYAYQAFLNDLQAMEIPPYFFLTKDGKRVLKHFRDRGTFWKIWTEASSSEHVEDEGSVQGSEGSSYEMNSKGDYLNCLKERTDRELLSEFLISVGKAPQISPGLTAQTLVGELQVEEFDAPNIRLIVAINFYYGMILNLKDS